jgi:GalNAc-alpha-(1->4)-GalNAc-alpha-(1->3)-diNAcBac-PP-undecaprenol alpha-1,4-N-acetyl-D-galactosaminyltransferase
MKSDAHARPPQILLVTESLEGGGAERVLADMANYWAAQGWKVTLATWRGPEVADFYSLDPAVRRIWLAVNVQEKNAVDKVRVNLARVFKLRRLLRASEPDAVLSFIDVPNVLTVLATLGLKTRVVISERHNPDQTEGAARYAGAYTLPRPWRVLRRLVYRWADSVTALNEDAARWIAGECGVSVEVIPNPIRPMPHTDDARERLVLGVGRLARQKGFDLLIRAFAKIAQDFPDWHLMIFGKGPEHAALSGLRDSLAIRDRIEIREPVRNIETWMSRAGLIVLPSRFEAYGNAILESLAMGAAVISTDCAGPASFIRDGVNGRLVPVAELEGVDALASAMSELMSDASLRNALGGEALRVRETHRQDVIMRKWEQCLLPPRAVTLRQGG